MFGFKSVAVDYQQGASSLVPTFVTKIAILPEFALESKEQIRSQLWEGQPRLIICLLNATAIAATISNLMD